MDEKCKKVIKVKLSTVIGILVIIAILIGICIVGFKLYTENVNSKQEINDLNIKINTLENEQQNNNSVASNLSENKYAELTEQEYNNLSENQHFVIQNVTQNSNGTITITGRIYNEVDLEKTKITKTQYDKLISNKNIELFGEEYTLKEYEDFIPGYIVENKNGVGFYITNDYELIDLNETAFVKGTDKYYTVTINENIKLKSETFSELDGEEMKSYYENIDTYEDYDYINFGSEYIFVFKNGNVSQINYEF